MDQRPLGACTLLLFTVAATALQLPVNVYAGQEKLSQSSGQDSTLEIHVGPLPLPGAGGEAQPWSANSWSTPVWVRAGRWLSQPGAASAGWQYAAAADKPPAWSKGEQPSWARQAAPGISQLNQWVRGLEKVNTQERDAAKDATTQKTVKKSFIPSKSLMGWETKYVNAGGVAHLKQSGQRQAISEPSDDDDDDKEEEEDKPHVEKQDLDGKTNLSTVAHAFEERTYPAMMLLCGEGQSLNQENYSHVLAEAQRIMTDLQAYFDGKNSIGIPQVASRPWFGIWQPGVSTFRICNWLSQGKDYPPKPDEDSDLSLVAVPAANYLARAFSGRGGLHQIEDFTREAKALLADVRRAGLEADDTTIYVDSYNPITDTTNRRDEILIKKES